MKPFYTLLIAVLCSFTLSAQIIDIPDANFKSALIDEGVDTNNDGEISITEAEVIQYLDVQNRSISSLEGLQYFVDLREILFNNNQVTTFDSNGINTMAWVEGNNNQLVYVNLKDGYSPGYWDYYEYLARYEFNNNPIEVICRESGDQIHYDGGAINTSYCSFVPGGDYNVIQGYTSFDNNNDGCNESDTILPYLMYGISDGTTYGNVISNNIGEYAFYVADESYTFAPVIENASYFNISPESQTVSFPSDTSPFQQDFCVTPNGTYNDIEITLIPLNDAIPGFDADYKLLYKNKGTTVLSGSVDMTFQDDIMDLVSASPTEDSQTINTLTWNFTNLNPFETRAILVTMNINSPMESPAVNGGDILMFDAAVSTSETDETPDDNSFTLNQTVVNSFDPNDKICLEGETISLEMVGDYVHYRIRFENTGTANAINIVVKDNIDKTKYDLSTLVVLDASHDFVARIKDNGSAYYVEFIFENINLPFDDANNDGYVVFKIRTLDTLVLGDTFNNNARIYFDFNSPIITNVAQTTIATLSTEDSQFDDTGIFIYPNPTANQLYLQSKQVIKQISLYDLSGRLIKQMKPNGSKFSIDISTETLQAGHYILKIKTSDSEVIKKVIKS